MRDIPLRVSQQITSPFIFQCTPEVSCLMTNGEHIFNENAIAAGGIAHEHVV